MFANTTLCVYTPEMFVFLFCCVYVCVYVYFMFASFSVQFNLGNNNIGLSWELHDERMMIILWFY